MLDAENPGNESLPGSLIMTEQVPSLLIRVSRNWFVLCEIDLCFGKLICVWKIGLCFKKLFFGLIN